MNTEAASSPKLTYSPSPRFEREIDNVIDTALALNRIVGAVVLVAQRGDIVYRRAAGFADRESRRPMRPDTIFRLASVSKPIVSVAALALIEQAKLGLDDPVTKWLPEFRPRLSDGSEPVITVRHLLTHTAGLTYGFKQASDRTYHQAKVSDGLDQPGLSMTENLQRICSVPLLFPPGSSFQYSIAIDVLGAVLERVFGKPLPEVTAALVSGPLKLNDTGFSVQDRDRLAAAYMDAPLIPARMQDNQLVPNPPDLLSFSPNRIFNSASFPSGGTGMAGTATDFVVLLETLRTGGSPVLKQKTVDAMTTNQIGDYLIDPEKPGWGFGFGGSVLTDPAVAQTPQSKGTYAWGGAYGHTWFVDPQLELSVVAFTNTTPEGTGGIFPLALRDAIYRSLPE
ncbi:MAG: beta-lactamase family protein [Verrucomicrobia bacterium]|nr:beta-lactamase family protein [Verrucomicrobiota bacterium]